MDVRIAMVVIVVLIILVCFILPFLIKQGCKRLGLPRIPVEFGAERAQVVCTSVCDTYAFVLMLCTFLAIFFLYDFFSLVMAGEVAAILMLTFAFAFAALAVVAFIIMKNRVILLFPDRVIFRDTFGKVFCYSTEQVIGYVSIGYGQKRTMFIKTVDKKIGIEAKGTNFREAVAFVMANYREL